MSDKPIYGSPVQAYQCPHCGFVHPPFTVCPHLAQTTETQPTVARLYTEAEVREIKRAEFACGANWADDNLYGQGPHDAEVLTRELERRYGKGE